MKQFKIGNYALDSPTCLAPMAGVCNIAFRVMARRYGAGLVYSEFVNATAISRENEYAIKMMRTTEEERPVSIQLFGSEIADIKKATKLLQDKTDIVDFNFGCPAHQVTCTGAGAALLNEPEKVKQIVEAMVSVSEKPVTVKMRLGMNEKNITVLKLAKAVEAAGAAAVAVHGRTLEQQYSGTANWDMIKQVKETVNIPVIGNGDVSNELKAKEMIEQTGVDAVMVGRAACGNPFIFSRINHYLKTGNVLPQKGTIDLFFEYVDLWEKYEGLKFTNLRIQASYFTKGIPNAAQLRIDLVKARNVDEVKDILQKFKNEKSKDTEETQIPVSI
ncbi:tRNA dihydrouridine synthase DusB [Candidatus Woesearchaeota archaeon]|nr:tRNA dihydrouridine synthase DusB [Candidatus Woesearchaeota archaeon]